MTSSTSKVCIKHDRAYVHGLWCVQVGKWSKAALRSKWLSHATEPERKNRTVSP